MTKAGGSGAAFSPMVSTVDHDVPSDPNELRKRREAEADANIASLQAKVKRQKEHLAGATTKEQKERLRAHLKGAEDALAQATAARKKGLT